MNTLTIFYDGQCILCSKEVLHYKRNDKHNRLKLVNIKDQSFNAAEYGLSPEDVNFTLHTQDGQGNLYLGVDSFIEIWKRVTRYQMLAVIVKTPGAYHITKLGYIFFVKYIRQHLPQRECSAGDSCFIE